MKTNFELLSMQHFSLNICYYVGVSFVLMSSFFAEQYLFKTFVPILEKLSNVYAKASFGVLST